MIHAMITSQRMIVEIDLRTEPLSTMRRRQQRRRNHDIYEVRLQVEKTRGTLGALYDWVLCHAEVEPIHDCRVRTRNFSNMNHEN
jgi:hypothetical protein